MNIKSNIKIFANDVKLYIETLEVKDLATAVH